MVLGVCKLIHKYLIKIFLPILTFFLIKKYKGIWGLKKHLSASNPVNRILLEVFEAYFSRYGSWIGYQSTFKGVPCFPHGFYGIFISNGAKLGRDVVIFQQVTIGSNTLIDSPKAGSPTIGDNVYIGAGAKIIGNVSIGNNCRIGANAIVYQDMPPNSLAVQQATRIIQKLHLDNRYFSKRLDGKCVYFKHGKWVEYDDKGNDIKN